MIAVTMHSSVLHKLITVGDDRCTPCKTGLGWRQWTRTMHCIALSCHHAVHKVGCWVWLTGDGH